MTEINDDADIRLSAQVSEILTKADLLVDNVNININNVSMDIKNVQKTVDKIIGQITPKELTPISNTDYGWDANELTEMGIFCINQNDGGLLNYPSEVTFPCILDIKTLNVIYMGINYALILQEIRELLSPDAIFYRTGLYSDGDLNWSIWYPNVRSVNNITSSGHCNVDIGMIQITDGGTGANSIAKAIANFKIFTVRSKNIKANFNEMIEPGWFFISPQTAAESDILENCPPASDLAFHVLVLAGEIGTPRSTDIEQFALSRSGELFYRHSNLVDGMRQFEDWKILQHSAQSVLPIPFGGTGETSLVSLAAKLKPLLGLQ